MRKVLTMAVVKNSEGMYGKYYVTDLKAPRFPPEFLERYKQFGTRILWLDQNVVPGAFQINTSWYHHAMPEPIFAPEHVHPNDEVVGFFGSDPDRPEELNGEVEFTMEGETHLLTKSTMIFIPGGVRHLPLKLTRVDKPIFHFSICLSGAYVDENKDGRSIYDA